MGVVCVLYGMIGNIYVKRCVDEIEAIIDRMNSYEVVE